MTITKNYNGKHQCNTHNNNEILFLSTCVLILNIVQQIQPTPVPVAAVTAMITFYIRKTNKYSLSHGKRMLKSKCESLDGAEDDLKTVILPIFFYF